MTFSVKIRKSNAIELSELANIAIWQKITFIDNTTTVKKIVPVLIPLESTAKKMGFSTLILKPRTDKFTLYKTDLYNEIGLTIDRDVGGNYFFQFKPNDADFEKMSSIKKVEFSLNQNFAKTLTNLSFQNNFKFQKVTNTNFSFFFLAENGAKFYETLLKPFATDYPTNAIKIVAHSFESIELPQGFYTIDTAKYFFDSYNEVLPNHYIVKVTI